ncbi:hypothetical protein JCM5350_000727 [Sporobolomyces pararoseus]
MSAECLPSLERLQKTHGNWKLSQGVAEPLSVFVDSYGTVKEGKTDSDLTEIIKKNWDLRPGVIVKELNLQKAQYEVTAMNSDSPFE